MNQLSIKSRNVLIPQKGQRLGKLEPALIKIRDGKFYRLCDYLEKPSEPVLDFGDQVVMPGLCDTHVHMNEPGRTEWEGISTATQAAAAGGITTLVDMPLNSIPPTTTVDALNLKRESAQKTAYVDYGFWGGVIPQNKNDLEPLIQKGVLGFKCFMIDSGVSEFPMSSEEIIRQSLPILSKYNVPLLVHAELEGPLPRKVDSSKKYQSYLLSRPDSWEVSAVELLIKLAEEYKGRIHVVHLSSAQALSLLKAAQSQGISISAETCPHYLVLKAEDIAEGATHFKCAPPIRNNENRELLWKGLENNIIQFIVSDHSPCSPNLKKFDSGDFLAAWGGISGLQFGLSLIWTEMKKRNLALPELAYWMSEAPLNFLNVQSKTGRIEVGNDADLVVWDPNKEFKLEESQILHRHKITPYMGMKLSGVVERTFVRGQCVFESGSILGPTGNEVRRKQ